MEHNNIIKYLNYWEFPAELTQGLFPNSIKLIDANNLVYRLSALRYMVDKFINSKKLLTFDNTPLMELTIIMCKLFAKINYPYYSTQYNFDEACKACISLIITPLGKAENFVFNN
jgi:hypothetical protein